jgi:anti-sigma28 factor (negative regulator of flagellin synthesis)
MISQVNSAVVQSAYPNSTQSKEVPPKQTATVSGQGDKSKVDQIREALESGEYKINLEALSRKIADELM